MADFFTISGRSFEFGRTVADARRLLKKATNKTVFVQVRVDSRGGWGSSSATLTFTRQAFLKSFNLMKDDDAFPTHLHLDGDGQSALFVASPLAIDAVAFPAVLPDGTTEAAGATELVPA